MTIQELILDAYDTYRGVLDRRRIRDYSESENVSVDNVYNEISIQVAEAFLAGVMDYAEGDGIMNAVYALMIDDLAANVGNCSFSEPAYSIFEAFDQGEFDHVDGCDPVEKFTRPMLAEILQNDP